VGVEKTDFFFNDNDDETIYMIRRFKASFFLYFFFKFPMIFVAIKQPRFSLSMGLLWLFLGIDDVQKKKANMGRTAFGCLSEAVNKFLCN
jgi:hypothetical protein